MIVHGRIADLVEHDQIAERVGAITVHVDDRVDDGVFALQFGSRGQLGALDPAQDGRSSHSFAERAIFGERAAPFFEAPFVEQLAEARDGVSDLVCVGHATHLTTQGGWCTMSEMPEGFLRPSLKTKLNGPLPVTAPLVLNPLMARLVEDMGFGAGYLGGGSTGYQQVVLEANLNLTEMCQTAIDIRAVSSLPLIFDGACGFGDPMHMHRTIGMSEAAGFAAIEIEDQLVPKRAHHHIGIEHMIPLELMAAKVREAVAARRNPEFLIIARTNAMRRGDLDEALRRGEAYRAAGADVLLLAMARQPEQLRAIGERLGGPLMYLTGRGGLAGSGMTLGELGASGLSHRGRSDDAADRRLLGLETDVRHACQRLRRRRVA